MSARVKVNYYTFYLRDLRDYNHCYDLDLNKFLKTKLQLLKNINITLIPHQDGESMNLEFHQSGYFSFLKSRNAEHIRAVDIEKSIVRDISEGENKLHKIAFLSHFVIDGPLIAYAKSTLSPPCNALADFINKLFDTYFDGRYEFIIRPLMETISKDEVIKMPHIGRTSFEIEQGSSLFDRIIEVTGSLKTKYSNVGSIEVLFKPKKGNHINDLAINLISTHEEDKSIKNYKMQVKSDLYNNLIDVYLDGKGSFKDYILIDNQLQFAEQLKIKIESNRLIKQKLMEYQNECEAKKQRFEATDAFYSESHWTDIHNN